MSAGRGPRCDAFVVRLWRDAATGHVLRAEIEHVGTGILARTADVTADWILRQLRHHPADRTADEAVGAEPAPGVPGSPPRRP